MAKKELFDNPITRAVCTLYNCVPVDRNDVGPSTLKAINRVLKRGDALLMFPEGTRSKDGVMGAIKSGIGMIAVRNEVDILPVATTGLFEAKGRMFSRPEVVVRYGELIAVKSFQNGSAKKSIYASIAKALENKLQFLAASTAQ